MGNLALAITSLVNVVKIMFLLHYTVLKQL